MDTGTGVAATLKSDGAGDGGAAVCREKTPEAPPRSARDAGSRDSLDAAADTRSNASRRYAADARAAPGFEGVASIASPFESTASPFAFDRAAMSPAAYPAL